MSFLKKLFSKKQKTTNMTSASPYTAWSPGAPTFAVVNPGSCQFTEEFQKVLLKSKVQISPDTYVFTFATPDGKTALNLSTCACILARGGSDKDGKPVVRPYTPCSTNNSLGEFQLMIKIYEDGVMTQYLKSLDAGAEVEFKHIPFNVKIQYPFGKRFVGMIIGGTGITPMVQALHALLGNKADKTEVGMLYGSRTSDNILGRSTLDQWSKGNKRLTVNYVLSNEPEGSSWKGSRGFITKEMIQNSFPPPADDVIIFVCGPPPMYNLFCGPREDKENITGILGELGYTKDQVYKF